jgi:diadenosine tetraphosphate (Ap4A) HIT family hydrolase
MTDQEPAQDCPFCLTGQSRSVDPVLWEDDLWYVRHHQKPYPVAGWLTLVAKRHVESPAYFDEAEQASFGPRLTLLERTLEDVTGALRIYTASMNEAFGHVHVHMVPRYARMPGDVRTWGVFGLQRSAREGAVSVDADEVVAICEKFRARLVR